MVEINTNKMVMPLAEVGLTERQHDLLNRIHIIAREMERIDNTFKKHYLIALIEELSSGVIAMSYIKEKLEGLMR